MNLQGSAENTTRRREMPSASRFASLRDTVRNHPVVVASSAASVGVLLGAFVAVQLLATPQPRADSAAAPQAAVASKGEAKPVPETTGSAPAGDRQPAGNVHYRVSVNRHGRGAQ